MHHNGGYVLVFRKTKFLDEKTKFHVNNCSDVNKRRTLKVQNQISAGGAYKRKYGIFIFSKLWNTFKLIFFCMGAKFSEFLYFSPICNYFLTAVVPT